MSLLLFDQWLPVIVIATAADDLHARIVKESVRSIRGHPECHIVECDRLSQREGVTYGVNYAVTDRVLTSERSIVSISDANIVWFRRTSPRQRLDLVVENEAARSLIDNDCRGALNGLLTTHFHGKWISSPEATYRASDKIGQLEAALRRGFRVSRTLVTHHARQYWSSTSPAHGTWW